MPDKTNEQMTRENDPRYLKFTKGDGVKFIRKSSEKLIGMVEADGWECESRAEAKKKAEAEAKKKAEAEAKKKAEEEAKKKAEEEAAKKSAGASAS